MQKQDYGIDAPRDMAGLLWRGAVFLVVGIAISLWIRSHEPAPAWLYMLRSIGAGGGIAQLVFGGLMWWSSRYGKFVARRSLLDMRAWRGDEAVLDVGCGRGLMLVGAAERLTAGGRATGIDLWQARDLSGNTPDAVRANAAAAGVAERVSIDTGDARALPYADGSFDVIVSMTVLHNISGSDGRAKALDEMLRVLTPGGAILLFDIFAGLTYPRVLRRLGAEVVRTRLLLLWGVPGLRLLARKR